MATSYWSGKCPRCGGNCEFSEDTRYGRSAVCLDCGWRCWTEEDYLDLADLNDRRIEVGLEPLKEVNKREEDNEAKTGEADESDEDEKAYRFQLDVVGYGSDPDDAWGNLLLYSLKEPPPYVRLPDKDMRLGDETANGV
jgi:hypothetical protein